jgi:hypothetical protein
MGWNAQQRLRMALSDRNGEVFMNIDSRPLWENPVPGNIGDKLSNRVGVKPPLSILAANDVADAGRNLDRVY